MNKKRFDIVLEVMSLVGMYSYCINSLIAVLYSFANLHPQAPVSIEKFAAQILLELNKINNSFNLYSSGGHAEDTELDFVLRIILALNSIITIIQGTVQTLFILECLRRYAYEDKPFMRKPARELITALLSNYDKIKNIHNHFSFVIYHKHLII